MSYWDTLWSFSVEEATSLFFPFHPLLKYFRRCTYCLNENILKLFLTWEFYSKVGNTLDVMTWKQEIISFYYHLSLYTRNVSKHKTFRTWFHLLTEPNLYQNFFTFNSRKYRKMRWILKSWFKSTNYLRTIVEMYQTHIS